MPSTSNHPETEQNSRVFGTVVIASRSLPNYWGGLSQYQRGLAEHLAVKYGIPGVFWGEDRANWQKVDDPNVPLWQFKAYVASSKWEKKLGWLMKLASKRRLHGLAEKIIVSHWKSRIIKDLPADFKALHFVGTGWDFLGFAMVEIACEKGVPFTVWPAVHPGDWGDDLIDLRLYKKADRVFAQSDYEKSWLIEKGLAEDKIVRTGLPPMCLPNGDEQAFRIRHGLNQRPIVLFLGRKDEGKGYVALVNAWKEVHKVFPSACLVTIGPQKPPIDPVVGEEQEGILNLGVVSEQEKADVLAACQVFCLPSAHESFGIVYLEAWFYSKPVICGTAPACRELIENGVDGLWSTQNNVELKDSICQLLEDPEKAKRLGENGKRKQEAHYTWEKVGEKHVKEFFAKRQ